MDERVKTKSGSKSGETKLDQRLNDELDDSFPASDPPSLTQPSGLKDRKVVSGKPVKSETSSEK
jgi:hypothetical protein